MENSILYYPTINFQTSDYKWLWSASLLFDKIYRIVPPDYDLDDCENVRILCESGDIGVALSPIPYTKSVGLEFSKFMSDFGNNAAAFDNKKVNLSENPLRVHLSKVDGKLKQELLYSGKIIEASDGWLYYSNPNEANLYMTFLAKHIAEKNNLSLYTNDRTLWTTATYFQSDGQLQPDCFVGSGWTDPCSEALISLMFSDVFPDNVLNIPASEIINFREKRKDERQQFINAVNDFRIKLSQSTAPEIVKEIINDEKGKIEKAKRDFTRSMDLLNVFRFTGILTTLCAITSNALSYDSGNMTAATIFDSASIGISVLAGLVESRLNRKKQNSYTYLANLNKEFGSYYERPEGSLFHQYNYALFRDYEEFVND
ncbi:MAG: DUF6236 family protein [Oscillospiraceae bacterium]|jgi:hypothetical protein|nr:DUF6236 family protein [Oscillospiraceae bacterium]